VDEPPTETDLSKLYKYAMTVVFAVVIAESFPQSIEIFLPSNGEIVTYERFESGSGWFLAYFLVISSWIYYFRSIIIDPHTETRYGVARFTLDLIIVYLYYYLLILISDQPSYSVIFAWVFPVIFASYLAWDWLRYREYRASRKEAGQAHATRKNRLVITGIVLVAFVAMSVLYSVATPLVSFTIYGSHNAWNIIFIYGYLAILVVYRLKTIERQRRKARKRRTS
jgi:hypothetical protein